MDAKVKINTIIGTLFLLYWSGVALSGHAIHQTQDTTLEFAYEQLLEMTKALEQKTEECEAIREKNTLSGDLFKHITLSDKNWRTALGYLSSKSMYKCEELWEEVVFKYVQFRDLEKVMNKEPKTFSYDLETLCCVGRKQEIGVELEYLTIPKKDRETLEKITELQKPFDPIRALEALKKI